MARALCYKGIFHISVYEHGIIILNLIPRALSGASRSETWERSCTVLFLLLPINLSLGLKIGLSVSFARWLVLSNYLDMTRTLCDAGITMFRINLAPYSRI